MLYMKKRVRVHLYRHTDRRTDTGRDIVVSAMKQIATKMNCRCLKLSLFSHQGLLATGVLPELDCHYLLAFFKRRR